jgi:hypothetical protein
MTGNETAGPARIGPSHEMEDPMTNDSRIADELPGRPAEPHEVLDLMTPIEVFRYLRDRCQPAQLRAVGGIITDWWAKLESLADRREADWDRERWDSNAVDCDGCRAPASEYTEVSTPPSICTCSHRVGCAPCTERVVTTLCPKCAEVYRSILAIFEANAGPDV